MITDNEKQSGNDSCGCGWGRSAGPGNAGKCIGIALVIAVVGVLFAVSAQKSDEPASKSAGAAKPAACVPAGSCCPSSATVMPAENKPVFREEPLVRDNRPADQVCSMCEKTIDPKNRVTADAPWGRANLCSVHCFAIYYSSLRDTNAIAGKVTMTDSSSGKAVPLETTVYLYTHEKTGRPLIMAFAEKTSATTESAQHPGEIMEWKAVLNKELARPCGFCGRALYEMDATDVALIVMQNSCCGGSRPAVVEQMYACCPMCALGICAKLQKDMEITHKDALTGEKVYVRIVNQNVEWVQPLSAVAWFGQKKNKDGKMVSAGCFHQFLFANEENLRKWLEKHPEESGAMITISDALADKMKLTPEQIANACKIGECQPK
jgi:hypothetical protein